MQHLEFQHHPARAAYREKVEIEKRKRSEHIILLVEASGVAGDDHLAEVRGDEAAGHRGVNSAELAHTDRSQLPQCQFLPQLKVSCSVPISMLRDIHRDIFVISCR